MNDRELSLQAGKSSNYLAEVKWRNPSFYNFLKKEGIINYENKASMLRAHLAEIYYEIKIRPDMSLTEFYNDYLHDQHASKWAFMTYKTITQYKTYKKIENIIYKFKQYKNTKG